MRCSLPTSLQSRAPLCRPLWTNSRLPHHGRSFAFAARLAKDQEVEAASNSKDVEPGSNVKEGGSKESNAGDKKKSEDGSKKKQGEEGSKRKETSKPSKPSKPSTKDSGKDAEPKTKGKKKEQKDGAEATKGRRARVRKMVTNSNNSQKLVEQKIARMRRDIEAIQESNKENLDKTSSDAEGVSIRERMTEPAGGRSLKDALLDAKERRGDRRASGPRGFGALDIHHLDPDELDFAPVDYMMPAVPRLSYGLDRVLFNAGVYRLQDPRSRIYNFDPYLEKIMDVGDFNFDALSEYKTSSKDEDLLALTQRMETKFTGSTSSMSGILQHFHFLLSNFRGLNHQMLSKEFPETTGKFSNITLGPSAIFVRPKDGVYAIDADKEYDMPNIMSWLGHSLEKLLTVEREEFEKYRRSNSGAVLGKDESGRCYHYSKLGNFLMRSQLDAHDPRLPGAGIFDVKTRAVVSIRMNHEEYEQGKGYQIRYDLGEWESYEREFYDMTRATMLKYSLQVRMGRMDGIFVAYHNVERIFGFQYLPLEAMDNVLHGQKDACLGDQEFKMSISLLDELMQKATEKFPNQTLRMFFHAHNSGGGNPPFMYVFAEPMTEEQADAIQNKNQAAMKAFERDVVGIKKDDPSFQAEWQEIQDKVDEQVEEAENAGDKDVADVNASDQGSIQGSVEESAEEVTEEATKPTNEGVKEAEPGVPKGPLMAWTLAVRHRLNGSYVERPEQLKPDDSWKIEYHIRELNEGDRWPLYEKIKKKRHDLIGQDREVKQGLQRYRSMIKKYTNRGRRWREEEDALAANTEPNVFQPLGPGSEAESRVESQTEIKIDSWVEESKLEGSNAEESTIEATKADVKAEETKAEASG